MQFDLKIRMYTLFMCHCVRLKFGSGIENWIRNRKLDQNSKFGSEFELKFGSENQI